MTAPTVRFRQGAGRLCLDFIRTLRYRGTDQVTEELTDAAALAEWVRQCGPVDLDPGHDSDAFAEVRAAEVRTAGLSAAGSAAAGLSAAGLVAAAAATGAGAVPADEGRALREAVYGLIAATRGPVGVGGSPAAVIDMVNQTAAQPTPTPTLHPSGRLRWQADDPVRATLALVARDALDLVTSAAVTRVRECADPTCGALFVDHSRPGSRRWCSMDICGNRAKKTTLRARAGST